MTLPRLLAGVRASGPLPHTEHTATHGPLPPAGPELLDEVRRAGLTGRGGAAFPTAAKLEAVRGRRGPRLVLVNGAEGEPLSAKDRTLLEHAPHLVLDGALTAAAIVGADRITVAVRADAAGAAHGLRTALAERRDAGRIRVVAVPVAHLAGEETALIRHLDGGPLAPTLVPPRPAERGLRRRPTLVQNVETLAHLALVARHGASWFRAVGTREAPGSALVTVSGAVRRPGVVEIAQASRLADVLDACEGTIGRPRGVLVGGFHGTWLPGAALGAIRLDDRALAAHGARLAAGVLMVLGEAGCAVHETAAVLDYLARESAHQCGPCRNGLPAIAALVADMADGRAPRDAGATLRRWSAQIRRRGACSLPDGAVRFLASALEVFAADFADHERHGPCEHCRRPPTVAVAPPAPEVAA